MGPSGSGKSTLLNIIGLLDRQTTGSLEIDGRNTHDLDDAEITRLRGHAIGFIFQSHMLIPAFTACENVMMPLIVANGRANAAIEARAAELLERVGLSAVANNRALEMSGGQQQRVAVALAFAMRPKLVLADEPTGNLDTMSAEGVFALMREHSRANGTTFLIVTHNKSLAQRCDGIIEVIDGRVRSKELVSSA